MQTLHAHTHMSMCVYILQLPFSTLSFVYFLYFLFQNLLQKSVRLSYPYSPKPDMSVHPQIHTLSSTLLLLLKIIVMLNLCSYYHLFSGFSIFMLQTLYTSNTQHPLILSLSPSALQNIHCINFFSLSLLGILFTKGMALEKTSSSVEFIIPAGGSTLEFKIRTSVSHLSQVLHTVCSVHCPLIFTLFMISPIFPIVCSCYSWIISFHPSFSFYLQKQKVYILHKTCPWFSADPGLFIYGPLL